MDLFPEIIDLGKDLIEKYSLIPVDIEESNMFLIFNKNLLVDIMIWRDETYVSLVSKSNVTVHGTYPDAALFFNIFCKILQK